MKKNNIRHGLARINTDEAKKQNFTLRTLWTLIRLKR